MADKMQDIIENYKDIGTEYAIDLREALAKVEIIKTGLNKMLESINDDKQKQRVNNEVFGKLENLNGKLATTLELTEKLISRANSVNKPYSALKQHESYINCQEDDAKNVHDSILKLSDINQVAHEILVMNSKTGNDFDQELVNSCLNTVTKLLQDVSESLSTVEQSFKLLNTDLNHFSTDKWNDTPVESATATEVE